MEFGLQLGNLEFAAYRDAAQAAEELGYHLITFPDHIVHERMGGECDENALSYDPIAVAAVVCEATKRIQVGHLVLCNLFRHPAITAQSLVSLDRLSGGRVFAGIGGGWTETEFRMTGIPFPDVTTRLAMLDEAILCMRSLWEAPRTTFEGKFYRFREAILEPKPSRRLPILLGGGGRGLLRLAAKHADVVNIIADVGRAGRISVEEVTRLTDERFRDKVRFVRAEASRNGREPSDVRVSNGIFSLVLTDSPEATRETAAAMAPLFRTSPDALLCSPLALIGTPEECVHELRRRAREWDVSQFVFSGGAESLLERLWREVLAHV